MWREARSLSTHCLSALRPCSDWCHCACTVTAGRRCVSHACVWVRVTFASPLPGPRLGSADPSTSRRRAAQTGHRKPLSDRSIIPKLFCTATGRCSSETRPGPGALTHRRANCLIYFARSLRIANRRPSLLISIVNMTYKACFTTLQDYITNQATFKPVFGIIS